MELQREKNVLPRQQESQSELADRVNELERSQYMYEQYGRRESVEITGIPANIIQENHFDNSVCHRIGKKVTIVRFVNRKFAYAGLSNGKNLKRSCTVILLLLLITVFAKNLIVTVF